MPTSQPTPVKKLKLDLANYRTMKQADERGAVEAIIAINPDWFWALMESLLETGYLPTENILVLQSPGARATLVVKEGNRRISALKLIVGMIPMEGLPIPQNILAKISTLSQAWKRDNANVPCVIYSPEESATVNRIRSLTHGKGEKAGRDGWTAVARARHNRDENGASEPALDLLEKYFKYGKNHTAQQIQRWAGDYKLSVLEEAMKRMASRLGSTSSPELGKLYPKINHKAEFDNIILDIGRQSIGFDSLRSRDVASEYGIPENAPKGAADSFKSKGGTSTDGASGKGGSAASGGGAPAEAKAAAATGTRKIAAVAIQDPKQVARTLKRFSPMGLHREKVVSLLIEMRRLKLDKNPIAFCFLLRSMFEISAKAYCTDHKTAGLTTTKGGVDKKLVDILREVTNHLTKNGADKEMQKRLHGPMTGIAKHDGILSVTSMNQLVHNQSFAHQPSDLAVLFGNVFPLLESMNS